MAANDGIVNEGRAVAEKARVGQPRSASGIPMLDRGAGAPRNIGRRLHPPVHPAVLLQGIALCTQNSGVMGSSAVYGLELHQNRSHIDALPNPS